MLNARERAIARRDLIPPCELSVREWAEGRMILPREMASEPGPISLDRTPYLRRIFDDLADPLCEEVVLMFATQLGKSTALLALLGYIIDHYPAPVMMVLPTVDVAKKFSKQRIAPLISANPNLRSRVKDAKARDSGNTTLVKEFAGGFMVITGANSPAGLASMPSKVLLFDEVDDYPDDAGGQGEPIQIATARQDTFGQRKRVKSSSPKRPKGLSIIESAYQAGTMADWFVPCPECGAMQTLVFANLRWPSEPTPDPERAQYACCECGALIPEHKKPAMHANGEWREAMPGSAVRSYRLNSLNSPLGWLPWRTVAREFLAAKTKAEHGNPEPLRTFVNTRLCETWEAQADKIIANELQRKAEDFPLGTVPAEALVLVAFCDVQDDRFEVGVYGVGQGGAMWTVDHVVLFVDPGHDEDWAKLDDAFARVYPHALGGTLTIAAGAIDSGGHYTHEVYRFVRRLKASRKIAATKGQDKPGLPILGRKSQVDVNWRGGVIKGGVALWSVGVNSAKDELYSRIRSGRVHISRALPTEWFQQMGSEHRVLHKTARGERSVWIKRTSGARNEALDCAVGAIWCAERLGVSRWAPKTWERLRERVTKAPEKAPETAPREPEAAAEGSDHTEPPKAPPGPVLPGLRGSTTRSPRRVMRIGGLGREPWKGY